MSSNLNKIQLVMKHVLAGFHDSDPAGNAQKFLTHMNRLYGKKHYTEAELEAGYSSFSGHKVSASKPKGSTSKQRAEILGKSFSPERVNAINHIYKFGITNSPEDDSEYYLELMIRIFGVREYTENEWYEGFTEFMDSYENINTEDRLVYPSEEREFIESHHRWLPPVLMHGIQVQRVDQRATTKMWFETRTEDSQ